MLAQREKLRLRRGILALAILLVVVFCPSLLGAQETSRIIYRNPRAYIVDFTFELSPDRGSINPSKDLKLWIPVPREWDSQRAVRIIAVQPPPQATFEDPDYGNRMFFWDFGNGPERATYRVNLRFRLESFEVRAEVDPSQIDPYDKSSSLYRLYTRSGHTVAITPKVRELARQAIGNETNPYLQAERILRFVAKKIRYKITFMRGIPYLLSLPVRDEKSGEEYYVGDCTQYAALFVAMCRAVGIPARCVYGFVGWRPWVKPEELKNYSEMDTQLSPIGTAGAENRLALAPHMWAEFYLPNVGWIPADANADTFGKIGNWAIIMSKGRDIKVGPDAPQGNEGYGFQWVPLWDGRVDGLLVGVWNIAHIRKAKTILVHSAPFPLAKFLAYLFTTIFLSGMVGGVAGSVCCHRFRKYALVGLATAVPLVGLVLPVTSVSREKQVKGSRASLVMLFWAFCGFFLLLLLFPLITQTSLLPGNAWPRACLFALPVLSVLLGWVPADIVSRRFRIKSKPIRWMVKAVLFLVFFAAVAWIMWTRIMWGLIWTA